MNGRVSCYRFDLVREEVEALIAEVIRPLMEADGGGVELISVEGATVTLRLLRACAGCPGAPYTRAGVIEPLLRKALGPSVRVRLTRAPTVPGTPAAMRKRVPKETRRLRPVREED